MLTEVQPSCGLAEWSHMPFSLALLAEELIPRFKKYNIICFQRRPQGSVLGVHLEEGLFMVCPFGQNTVFERVGRTFGSAQYIIIL